MTCDTILHLSWEIVKTLPAWTFDFMGADILDRITAQLQKWLPVVEVLTKKLCFSIVFSSLSYRCWTEHCKMKWVICANHAPRLLVKNNQPFHQHKMIWSRDFWISYIITHPGSLTKSMRPRGVCNSVMGRDFWWIFVFAASPACQLWLEMCSWINAEIFMDSSDGPAWFNKPLVIPELKLKLSLVIFLSVWQESWWQELSNALYFIKIS